MAAVSRRKYGQGAVYGSLAYDFDNPELYGDYYSTYGNTAAAPGERSRVQPKTHTRTETRVRTRARTVVHTKQGISPTAILGGVVAAIVLVVALMASIRLMDVSASSVELQSQLTQLEEDQAKLRIAYESAFNLAEIEEYATKSLGMQKPRADQIYYIDTSSPDKSLVLASPENKSVADKVADFIAGLGEYFG